MTSFISPSGECEYFKTIAAANLPELRKLLGIQPGDDLLEVLEARWKDEASNELEQIVEQSGIPVEFDFWP